MKPLSSLLIAFLVILPVWLPAAPPQSSGGPNFLIFLTDDESWLERSIYGWSKLPTPNFDRVAREGVLFTHGYCSAPSCAPSRAALLTGRNFWELEQGAFIQAWLPQNFAVLPELLGRAGYHTGYTGKGWGPGVLAESGRSVNPAGVAFNSAKRPATERLAGVNPIDYAENLRQFLNARQPGQPFWFWVGSTEPHAPCAADNWKKLESKHGLHLADIPVPEFLPNTPGVRRSRANMLYELCLADEDLGRVLQVLQDAGELANTLVIVTGDNGTGILRAKTNLYDWGVHEPLAMMWPARIKAGRRVDDFVNFIDIAPTLLEAAGLPVPPEMSGRSLTPLLISPDSGRLDPGRSFTVCGLEWHGEFDPINLAGRTIRDERYHYIVNYGSGPRIALPENARAPDADYAKSAESNSVQALLNNHAGHPALQRFLPLLINPRPREELYDLQEDPWELHNLASSAEHAGIKARLKSQLEDYQRRTKDPRLTGDLKIFEQTRNFVQERKKKGYGNE